MVVLWEVPSGYYEHQAQARNIVQSVCLLQRTIPAPYWNILDEGRVGSAPC
jgi:hypothetical protein